MTSKSFWRMTYDEFFVSSDKYCSNEIRDAVCNLFLLPSLIMISESSFSGFALIFLLYVIVFVGFSWVACRGYHAGLRDSSMKIIKESTSSHIFRVSRRPDIQSYYHNN